MSIALQDWRLLSRLGGFKLFILAPPLIPLHLELGLGHFTLLGLA